MDQSFMKQTRHASTRHDNKEDGSSRATDKKIQPQQTQSFKERRRNKSWIRRQFSGQMNSDDDADHHAAVAAAAYAIQSLDESKPKDRKDATYGPDRYFKSKSKVEDRGVLNERLKSALKSSDNKSTKEPSLMKRISFQHTEDTKISEPERPAVETEVDPTATKRLPTLADKPQTITAKPNIPTAQPDETRKRSATTRPGPKDSQADAWEKEQMSSIKQRYEKLRATIDKWETDKKKRAIQKIERTQAELDKKRERAIQRYRDDIKKIEKIAEGARKQAEENRKKEDSKVKEKAHKIRLTGKIPATCLCF